MDIAKIAALTSEIQPFFIKQSSHVLEECRSSWMTTAAVLTIALGALNLMKRAFFTPSSINPRFLSFNRQMKAQRVKLLVGATLLGASAFNPFPYARSIGTIAAIASFFLPKPKRLS